MRSKGALRSLLENESLRRFSRSVRRSKVLSAVIPDAILQRAAEVAADLSVASYADRQYLERVILPAIARQKFEKVLFVGCRAYTKDYGRYFKESQTEFWTTDVDPDAARWGEKSRHRVCDVQDIDRAFAADEFDVVLLNGVFGFGVDDEAAMNRTATAIHRILGPDGILMIGWNVDRSDDPLELESVGRLFEPGPVLSLPERKSFDDVSHVFDFVRRKPVAQSTEVGN